MNGDIVLLRDGHEWEDTIRVDQTGGPIIPVDESGDPKYMTGGGTFIFDPIPTASGICVGACIPLPTLVMRVNLANLKMQDFITLRHRIRTGTLKFVEGIGTMATGAPFDKILPADAIADLESINGVLMGEGDTLETPSFEPWDLNLNKLQLYFSTHEVREFGVDFARGRIELDADVTLQEGDTKEVKFLGSADTSGLVLRGRLSPTILEHRTG